MKISQQKIPATLDLSVLPESAQEKVYRTYLSAQENSKPSVAKKSNLKQRKHGVHECALLSEAALAKDWLSKEDEEAWKEYQPK